MMRSFCLGIDYVPKALPLGYELLDFRSYVDCLGGWLLLKALPLGYGLLGFQPVWIVWG